LSLWQKNTNEGNSQSSWLDSGHGMQIADILCRIYTKHVNSNSFLELRLFQSLRTWRYQF